MEGPLGNMEKCLRNAYNHSRLLAYYNITMSTPYTQLLQGLGSNRPLLSLPFPDYPDFHEPARVQIFLFQKLPFTNV